MEKGQFVQEKSYSFDGNEKVEPPPPYEEAVSQPTPSQAVHKKSHHCCIGRRVGMGMAGPQFALGDYLARKIRGCGKKDDSKK